MNIKNPRYVLELLGFFWMLHFKKIKRGQVGSRYLSKEVWKILPSYEELRRGAIGRGKEVEVMSIRCHVN